MYLFDLQKVGNLSADSSRILW